MAPANSRKGGRPWKYPVEEAKAVKQAQDQQQQQQQRQAQPTNAYSNELEIAITEAPIAFQKVSPSFVLYTKIGLTITLLYYRLLLKATTMSLQFHPYKLSHFVQP
jgi:hypothetical protein